MELHTIMWFKVSPVSQHLFLYIHIYVGAVFVLYAACKRHVGQLRKSCQVPEGTIPGPEKLFSFFESWKDVDSSYDKFFQT